MRSTGFVVLSITLHIMCVVAIALTPTRTISSAGENVEINIDVPADKAGAPQAAPAVEEAKPQASAPIEDAQPKVKKAAPAKIVKAKAAKPKAVASELPKKAVVAESMDPVVEDKDTVAVVKAEEPKVISEDAKTSDESKAIDDEKAVLTPVKETAPDGVEAAAANDDSPAAQPTSSEEPQPPANADDHASAQPLPAPVVATSTAAQDSASELNKGGASKEGAVSYMDLKQLPGNKPPSYPINARIEKRQGQLELLYRVTKDGKVTDVSVAKSSGYKDLDNAAVSAIAQFRFVPGQEGWARHPVNFYLKGPVATLPSQLRGKGAQAD